MKRFVSRPLFLVLLAPVWMSSLMSHAQEHPADDRRHVDLPYVTDGHSNQKLDLYLPTNPGGPLLVYIHGGGWSAGSKIYVPPLDPLLQAGYAVASIEYRFVQHAPFPAQIEDCKAAIRWLRAHAEKYGYDPTRIGAMGESAGGHLTALLATTGDVRNFDVGEHLDQSSAILCGIDFFGPTNLPGYPADHRLQPLLTRLLDGPVTEKAELAAAASPLHWVTAGDAPLFILQGTTDVLVPADQSTALEEKYRETEIEVICDVIEGVGHGGPEFWEGDRPQRMADFLSKHLRAKPKFEEP